MNSSSTRKKSSAKGTHCVPVETSGRAPLPSRLPELARGSQEGVPPPVASWNFMNIIHVDL